MLSDDTPNRLAGEFKRAAEVMQREGGGLYGASVMRAPFLQHGLALARKYFEWAQEAARRARAGEPSMLCLLCDVEFPPNLPGAMTVVMPMADNPSVVVLSPVCDGCAAKHDDDELSTAAMKSLLPKGSRTIAASEIHGAGHA